MKNTKQRKASLISVRKLGILMALFAFVAVGLALLAREGTPAAATTTSETATMRLLSKSPSLDVLVKDKVTVSVNIANLTLANADGDGKLGYKAWQARVSYPGSDLQLQSVVFKTDLLTRAQNPPAPSTSGTVLVGASIGVGQNESTLQDNPVTSAVEGNVVNLTFQCTAPGAHKVALSTAAADTHIISESGETLSTASGKGLTVSPVNVVVDCRAAKMSLVHKSGGLELTPGVFHVKDGGKVVVSVRVDAISNLKDGADPDTVGGYKSVSAQVTGISGNLKQQSVPGFATPPCAASKTTDKVTNPITVSCGTVSVDASTFTGQVFDLTLRCNAAVAKDSSHALGFGDVGGRTSLTDENDAAVNPRVVSGVTIRCLGPDTDKDGDGCTNAQEAANGTNPNVADWPDVNNDANEQISIGDILAYVQSFGLPKTGPTARPAKVIDLVGGDNDIALADIIAVVNHFGKNCKGAP